MFCTKCGTSLHDGSAFCHACGTPLQGQTQNNQSSAQANYAGAAPVYYTPMQGNYAPGQGVPPVYYPAAQGTAPVYYPPAQTETPMYGAPQYASQGTPVFPHDIEKAAGTDKSGRIRRWFGLGAVACALIGLILSSIWVFNEPLNDVPVVSWVAGDQFEDWRKEGYALADDLEEWVDTNEEYITPVDLEVYRQFISTSRSTLHNPTYSKCVTYLDELPKMKEYVELEDALETVDRYRDWIDTIPGIIWSFFAVCVLLVMIQVVFLLRKKVKLMLWLFIVSGIFCLLLGGWLAFTLAVISMVLCITGNYMGKAKTA